MADERKAYAERKNSECGDCPKSPPFQLGPGFEPATGNIDPTTLEHCRPLQWGPADLVNDPAIVNDQQHAIPTRRETTYSQPLPNKVAPRGSQTPNAGIPGNGGWGDFTSGVAADLLPAELLNRNTEVVIDRKSGVERMVYLGQGEQRSQSSTATSKGRPTTPGPNTPGKGSGKDKGTSRHNNKRRARHILERRIRLLGD